MTSPVPPAFVPPTGRYAIRSESNVRLALELAGWGRRFLALIVDILLVELALSPIDILLYFFFLGSSRASDVSASMFEIAVGGVNFLVLLGYFVLYEGLLHGTTVGKNLLHIRVVRGNGGALSLLAALMRNLLLPLDMAVFGAWAMFSDRNQRRLGDLVAGTVVVRNSHVSSVGVGHARAVVIPQLLSPPPPGIDPALLSPETTALIVDFLERSTLSRRAVDDVSLRLAHRILKESGTALDNPVAAQPPFALVYGTYLRGLA